MKNLPWWISSVCCGLALAFVLWMATDRYWEYARRIHPRLYWSLLVFEVAMAAFNGLRAWALLTR